MLVVAFVLGAAAGCGLGLGGGVYCRAAARQCSLTKVNVAFLLWCCGGNKGLLVAFSFASLVGNNINVMNMFWWWRLCVRCHRKVERICCDILLPGVAVDV